MTTYDNTNQGAIWPNKNKTTDKHPTHTGSINVEGVEYWVSAWVGDKTKNQPSLNFKLQKKEAIQATKPKQQAPSDDYDIPF